MRRSTSKHQGELQESSRREGGGFIWTRGVKIKIGKPTEIWICGSSQTLNWKLWRLHGTELAHALHVGNSFVALSVCGTPGSGPGSIPGAWAGVLKPISYSVMPCSTLTSWWVLVLPQLNVPRVCWLLVGNALPFLRRGWQGVVGGGGDLEEGKEGELKLVCKTNIRFHLISPWLCLGEWRPRGRSRTIMFFVTTLTYSLFRKFKIKK